MKASLLSPQMLSIVAPSIRKNFKKKNPKMASPIKLFFL
jgi:hypothetical protein